MLQLSARFAPISPRTARVVLLAALAGLSACTSSLQRTDGALGLITPYRVEVVQGNVVTEEMVAQIKPGMTRLQVRDLMGSPLVTDAFHQNRWDYVFTIRRQGAEPQKRVVVVTFDGDTLKEIKRETLPTEQAFVASIDTFKTSRNAPALALTPAQIEALPKPARGVASDATDEPLGARRPYPPLEK